MIPRACGVSVLLSVQFCVSGLAIGLEISTNAAERYQTIEGWGTSGSSTAMNNTAWRNAYRDLGLNLFRVQLSHEVLTPARTDYNNNGTLDSDEVDYRVRIPLLGSTPEENVAKFNMSLNAGETRSGNFANWLSGNALEPERVKIVGSLWTPPHWMKAPTGASVTFLGQGAAHPTPWMRREFELIGGVPRGQGDSIGGRLRTEDPTTLTEYGLYIASHVKAFEQTFGVDLHALSLQNESTFENPFISAVLNRGPKPAVGNSPEDYTQYAKALKSVRDAWQAYGLDTKIKGPHVALNQLDPANPWSVLQQMNYINAVRNDSDPTLIDFIDYYNNNYYSGSHEAGAKATAGYYHGRSAVDANWAPWLPASVATGVKQDGKPIWVSETGYELNSWLGANGMPSNGAINVAALMFNALTHSDASAYIYWQFTDGTNQATTYGLLGSNQVANPHASAKYVSFKHFSRFVRPGAVRLDATFDDGFSTTGGASEYDTPNSVNVASFLHEEDETLTYVLLNMKNSVESITLNLPDGFDVESFQAYRSTETERFVQLADMTVANGQVSFTLPQYALLTLVGNVLSTALAGDFNDDGIVDAADYTVWRNHLGETNESNIHHNGDGGDVGMGDYAVWKSQFGSSLGGVGSRGGLSVPEPASWLLTGHLVWLAIRRRPRP